MVNYVKLKAFRQNAGYSLSKLANLTDCDRRTISYWENGEKEPCEKNLRKLAKIYHLDFEEFKEQVVDSDRVEKAVEAKEATLPQETPESKEKDPSQEAVETKNPDSSQETEKKKRKPFFLREEFLFFLVATLFAVIFMRLTDPQTSNPHYEVHWENYLIPSVCISFPVTFLFFKIKNKFEKKGKK